MKVLHAGKSLTYTEKVICKHCEAELEISPSDIKVSKADFPSYPDAYYVKCPCCNSNIYVDIWGMSRNFQLEIFKQ